MTETKRELSTEDRISDLTDDIRATGLGPQESARLARKFVGQRLATASIQRRYDHDAHVIYVDPKGERHAALVTAWWGEGADHPAGRHEPSCNVAYVNGDHDSVGKPVASASSVVHKSLQSAHGNYWCWPDEG